MPFRMPTTKRLLIGAVAIFLAILSSGCATYKVPSTAYGPKPGDPYYEARHKSR
jgi:PBP1b-binding outer membrane lipoprotein LpoB